MPDNPETIWRDYLDAFHLMREIRRGLSSEDWHRINRVMDSIAQECNHKIDHYLKYGY